MNISMRCILRCCIACTTFLAIIILISRGSFSHIRTDHHSLPVYKAQVLNQNFHILNRQNMNRNSDISRNEYNIVHAQTSETIQNRRFQSRGHVNIVRRLVEYMENKSHGKIIKYSLDCDVENGLRYNTNYSAKHFASNNPRLHPYMEVVDLTKTVVPSGNGFVCITTQTTPNFTMCLHRRDRDIYITRNLRGIGVWDNMTTMMLLRAMLAYPAADVIDAGANIGYFSQLAAAMGRNVVAIEPSDENLERFRAAAHTDRHWNRITLLRNALSDKRSTVKLSTSDDNQGNLFVIENGRGKSNENSVKTITFNDVRHAVKSSIAILKIDIEGSECRAFKRSSRLLKEVFIPYIFMEWMFTEHRIVPSSCTTDEVKHLVQFLTCKGYVPLRPSFDKLTRLDPAFGDSEWNKTVQSVVWQHKNAVDLPFIRLV